MVDYTGDITVGNTNNYDIVTEGGISPGFALTGNFGTAAADAGISEGGSVELAQATNIPSQMPPTKVAPSSPHTPVRVGEPRHQIIGGNGNDGFAYQKPACPPKQAGVGNVRVQGNGASAQVGGTAYGQGVNNRLDVPKGCR